MTRSTMLAVLGGMCSIAMSVMPVDRTAVAQDALVRMPQDGVSVRLRFGLKDKQTTAWDGSISLSQGEVAAMEVGTPRAGTAAGSSWKLKSVAQVRRGAKSVHDPKLAKLVQPVLTVTLDAPQAAKATVNTPQGSFTFGLSELQTGQPLTMLDGQVQVAPAPMSIRLTSGPDDEDWPAAAQSADGTVWLAYNAYKHGPPLDLAVLHEKRDFDALEPTTNGDQLRLVNFDGKAWSQPLPVTKPQADVWRPTVAVGSDSTVWVVWSQKIDANWDLYARGYTPSTQQWNDTRRLTDAPGADINAVAVAAPGGNVHVAWQGWRDNNFDILVTSFSRDSVGEERSVSSSPANQWWPAAACDSKGTLFVAFDTYERGNYDVALVADAAGENPRRIDVAATALHEARPSLALDKGDRVWVAFEEAGVNWGKDTGMRWRGPRGELLYWRREIVLRCVEGDRVQQAVGKVPCEPLKRNYPDAATRRMSIPRLAIDGVGRVWLLYRRHPQTAGGGEVWTSFATHHTGSGWSEPARLAHSENLMDNRPAVIPLDKGGALVVHSSDGRTNNTQSAKQNDLFCTRLPGSDAAKSPELAALPPAPEPPAPVHPNEVEDIKRIRAYRATLGGKTYQLLRGEFHRHTELTSHRDQDGTLEDMWRYGMDVAQMDWLGNGDHDNGYGKEHLWWHVQKQTDFLHHPPTFMPMFTYERSVTYPSGHRNAMFARRGIRPLPRIGGGKGPLYGTPEEGSPDIKTFYAYLKHFGGICASHTSGTNMGNDWRDNDPEVEPVVEIYQGLRHSYEHLGAPATAKGQGDAIGGFQPSGFVWNALMKGYRLGFQSSSDHYSTHISYAIVWAEDTSREAIVDAFKRRHSYAAHDNIILDVRCGDQMMGDIFTLDEKPKLDITVIGTRPIHRLSIIRGVGSESPQYVYDTNPNQQDVKLTWTDEDPEWGTTSYYYVRIEQEKPKEGYGALAWASPMWIDLEK